MKRLAVYGRRELALRAWTLVWLMLVWTMLWGNFSIANTITGLTVALAITVLLPMPRLPVEGRLHLLSLLRLHLQIAWYLLVSSVQVAWLAIRPGPPPLNAVLRVQVHIKSDLVLALFINTVCLIPGSMVLEVDQPRRLLYVHVVDVGTSKAVATFNNQLRTLERLFVAAFERDSEWHPETGASEMAEEEL